MARKEAERRVIARHMMTVNGCREPRNWYRVVQWIVAILLGLAMLTAFFVGYTFIAYYN